MAFSIRSCLILTFVGLAFGQKLIAPRLDLPNLANGYHGLVREDELVVEVTPPIRAIGAEVCRFRIVNRHHGDEPFEVIVKDKENGLAELRAKRLLNCEKRKNYRFDIMAVGCNGLQSENATVHISVVDVNEYAPTFLEPSYVEQVDEGKIYNEIVRVDATDRDCTPKFGDICKYEILTSDQPFVIDGEGVIRNTEPLDFNRNHNHILSVVAYDCGMKRSSPVMVTIRVNRVCQIGWKGIPERIDYAPGSGKQILFPEAQLELCDVPCTLQTMHSRLTLATSHIGKGCDRDTYSVQSQRKLCGASMDSVDLLPSPGLTTEWTKSLPTDEGREADQVFEFDGVGTSAIVPNNLISHPLGHSFTVTVWMKHGMHTEKDKHAKEHIMCIADNHKMNRHHLALFVRNCRLILLIRREPDDGNLNTFTPAEWRWKIPQVCDDEWHHYAVVVRLPEVKLYIDGQLLKTEKDNPEIIDDWPLHPTKNIDTKVAVGACWQGSESKMKHFFQGYLAGLAFLPHKAENPEVLACLHKCKESLEVPSMELLEPGMELLTNSDLTQLSLEGDNFTNLEMLIRRVGYRNLREFPTPGRRSLHLTTTITCDNGKPVKVPSSESFVMVLPPQQPSIIINGTANVAREYEAFRLGVRVFTNVRISVASDHDEKEWRNGEPVSVIEKKLDSCTISVYPPLNPDHETLTLPDNMMHQLGITYKTNKDGALLNGADMIYNYEQVLRQVQYSNRKPAYYLNRTFKLVCSELNGRFVSNEYVQVLTVVHPDPSSKPVTETTSIPNAAHPNSIPDDGKVKNVIADRQDHHESAPAHAHVHQHQIESKPMKINDVYMTSSLVDASQAVVATGGASHAVTIIIVVCIGFLVFMIILGIARIRAAHHRTRQEEIADTEMAWDDSALNITVNPMENLDVQGRNVSQAPDMDESESSDDSSCHDDMYSSDDDDDDDQAMASGGRGGHAGGVRSVMRKGNPRNDSCSSSGKKDLEWDNSTLSI